MSSTEAKVTVGSPATPYLPYGTKRHHPVGPIHTLPGYFEHGMSKGRPAMILTAPGGRVNVPAQLRYRETGSQHSPAPSTIVTAAEATEAA